MKWCCAQFEWHVSEGGSAGLAVVIDRSEDGKPVFLLQGRAITDGTEVPENISVALTIVSETGIAFCPWCGSRLSAFYETSASSVARPELRVPIAARNDSR